MRYASRAVRWMRRAASLALIAGCLVATLQAGVQEEQEYAIGPLDVLQVRVFGQRDLSGTYTVGLDGAVSFPLIGRISVGQRTVRAFERLLRERLAAGYLKDPHVTANVAEYRSRRVFVLGEVRQPGAYPLTGPMTVVELLALAGGSADRASDEAVVVRAGALAAGPAAQQDGGGAETRRVNLDAIARGDLADNVALGHGDTVFVPPAEVAYVIGDVRSPGRYAIRRDSSVLQVLSLAGGGTFFAALDRIRIVRTVGEETVEMDAKLSDRVQPDDVVRVPNRFFR